MSVLEKTNNALTESSTIEHLNLIGLSESEQKLFFMNLLERQIEKNQNIQNFVFILPSEKSAKSQFETFMDLFQIDANYPFLDSIQINWLPEKNIWGLDRYSDKSSIDFYRVKSLGNLTFQDKEHHTLVFTTLTALFQNTLPKTYFQSKSIPLKIDHDYAFEKLEPYFVDLGYISVDIVEQVGQYSIKGGIIDVFSPMQDYPLRLEFFFETLTSISEFSISSQLSTGVKLSQAFLLPVREYFLPRETKEEQIQKLYEILIEKKISSKIRSEITKDLQNNIRNPYDDLLAIYLRKENKATLSYLSPRDILIFPESIDLCLNQHEEHIQRVKHHFLHDAKSEDSISLSPSDYYKEFKSEELFENFSTIELNNPITKSFQSEIIRSYDPKIPIPHNPQHKDKADRFGNWIKYIKSILIKNDIPVIIVCRQKHHLERIRAILESRDLKTSTHLMLFSLLVQKKSYLSNPISLCLGDIDSYIFLDSPKVFIISEQTLLDVDKKTSPSIKKRKESISVDTFYDLQPGTILIHIQHGIGRFLELRTMSVSSVNTEFVVMEYAEGDKIYVPIDKLNLLQRYNFKLEGYDNVKLDKLRSSAWSQRKSRAKKAIEDMAEELLLVQAKRKLAKVTPLISPHETYFEIEAEFPHDETEDQLQAMEDIHTDLSLPYPMDRMVCGDVGFGKTEIALRTAARIALESKQVLILVPTTILCLQHFKTFQKRLEHHGLEVDYLNRTRKKSAADQILNRLKNGSLDILIGTHRILSKDINTKNLGLIVVDEEQRFGVKQKEILKKLKSNTHLLTLTATPIPRTLHMSTLGLKDISNITEPPPNRLAVRTHICPFDLSIIKKAIEMELKRDGQVFYLCNKVGVLESIASTLIDLMPDLARPAVAHGQMPAQKLETTMQNFIEKKFNILVCTTIMESGIDIGNANTLIVQDSQNYGLTQLYQIRGRIGRSNRQAYAYFCLNNANDLASNAMRRLEILKSNQGLGSGLTVAQFDLEMRGTGDILGGQQSGHISEVGFELYKIMLNQALKKLRNEEDEIVYVEPELKLEVEAFFPHDYIRSEKERLTFYKKLFAVEELEEIDIIEKELKDRFGALPELVQNLMKIGTIKCAAKKCRIVSIKRSAGKKSMIEIGFGPLKENHIKLVMDNLIKYSKAKLTKGFKVQLFPEHIDSKTVLSTISSYLEPLAFSFDLQKVKADKPEGSHGNHV